MIKFKSVAIFYEDRNHHLASTPLSEIALLYCLPVLALMNVNTSAADRSSA